MSLITATDLAKSYGAQDVFEGVSLEIPHGAHAALVGSNGSGKTSLLRLIAGLDQPNAGQVRRARGLRIGYLPQQAQLQADGTVWELAEAVFADVKAKAEKLQQLEAAMADPTQRQEAMDRYGPLLEAFEAAGGYTYQARIQQVLSGLGLDDFQQPLAHLSGGQRERALLARLLLEDPDLLLLDEPTNHLDLEGIEWLESYLTSWSGAMVVVAHDRAFLDQVADQVWELSFGHLTTYRGNYSQYVIQRADRVARQQEEYERQREEIARTEDYIRRYMVGQRTRQAQGRQKRLERVERIERPREARPIHLDLGKPLRSGDLVLGLYDLRVGYDPDAPLFTVQEVELRRGQRSVLLGPNGSGKTTLLYTILGTVEPLAGRVRLGAGVRVGHFAQAQAGLDREKTVLDTILDTGLSSVSQARDFLGQYHLSGDNAFKRVGDLSGGEQARVALALLALERANFLLLDEPTNHLDILSQEVLQEVLTSFQGTVLLVAHDRYLIRALATRVWAIVGGELRVFNEGYDAYRAWVQQQRAGGPATARERQEVESRKESARQEREAEKEEKRRVERLERQRAEVEGAIHQLETRLATLEAALAQASSAQQVDRVVKLGTEHRALQAELDDQLALWETLA